MTRNPIFECQDLFCMEAHIARREEDTTMHFFCTEPKDAPGLPTVVRYRVENTNGPKVQFQWSKELEAIASRLNPETVERIRQKAREEYTRLDLTGGNMVTINVVFTISLY